MHLYGSIEGIVDLLINNPELSLDDDLKSGDELDYTDEFVISPDIVAYNRMYNLLPANGERNVYYKEPSGKRFMELFGKRADSRHAGGKRQRNPGNRLGRQYGNRMPDAYK
ncbi:hypothetical protein SFC43_13170 [Bacteroides sp. CR5/BHMF/2]|nr:hypothetical protein [Bacteroides sp. CR5/BHMF/2]